MGFLEVIEIILGILLAILAVVIIGLVLFQQGRRSGINGSISGVADTFLSKNKAKTADAMLKKLTTIAGIVFGVLAVGAAVVATFLSK